MLTKNLKTMFFIAIALWVIFVYVDGRTKDKMQDYIDKYKTYQAQADSAIKYADSLKTQIVIEENEAHAAQERAAKLSNDVKDLKHKTSSLRTHVDTLRVTITDSTELARKIIPLQDSIIAQQDTTIKTQDSQISELHTALTRKDNSIFLLTTSRDSLQKVILNIPPAPKNPNKFLGIPLPSRMVVGTTAFIAGAITILVLRK